MLISDQQNTPSDNPATPLSSDGASSSTVCQEPYPGQAPCQKSRALWTHERVQQVKTPVTNTDDLNSVPGVLKQHDISCLLMATMCTMPHAWPHTLIHV